MEVIEHKIHTGQGGTSFSLSTECGFDFWVSALTDDIEITDGVQEYTNMIFHVDRIGNMIEALTALQKAIKYR